MGKEKKQPTGDYEVGYARPPVAHRYKKGESGNGRRRRNPPLLDTFEELLRKELAKTVSATEGGKEVKLPLRELVAQLIVRDLVNGTPQQRLKMTQALQSLGVLSPGPRDHGLDPDARRAFVERLAQEAEKLGNT